MKFPPRIIPFLVAAVALLLLYAEWNRFAGYFVNTTILGAVLLLEIVIACLWRFEEVFFPMTMGCFLAVATALPFGIGVLAYTVRWLFLGIGALVGSVIWMRTKRISHFEAFHLIAMFCVLAAVASATSSAMVSTGLLKAGSLLLLFLYASTGARAAFIGREKSFMQGMVLAGEVLAFATAGCYMVGYSLFGNPNSMGAIIGVVAVPILMWAAATSETRVQRQRRCLALALCGLLLALSVCRAAIMADLILAVAFAFGLRRPRTLVKAVFAGALLLEIIAVVNPSRMGELLDTVTGKFIFKSEGRHSGVFGSRRAPWDDTVAAVKKHPWFGTGFGTSDMGEMQSGMQVSRIYTVEGSNREHGSSYLAMAEYMGMLGILPFAFLILIVIRAVGQTCKWMLRTGSPFHYAAPFALITVAGLIHAAFEDWLFAAGSYLCVFFWVSAFLLVDLAPQPQQFRESSVSRSKFASALGETRAMRETTSA